MSAFDAAVAAVRSWTEPRGILRFVHDNFGVEPDPWQAEALLAFESAEPSTTACA